MDPQPAPAMPAWPPRCARRLYPASVPRSTQPAPGSYAGGGATMPTNAVWTLAAEKRDSQGILTTVALHNFSGTCHLSAEVVAALSPPRTPPMTPR